MKLSLRGWGLVVAQLGLAILAMMLVALAPSEQGRLLLVPLDGRPISKAAIGELMATPLKPGPLPGSWVVDGNRRLLSDLWVRRVVVLAAPAALCSSE